MIVKCSACGSADTQALCDINQCLSCGVLLEQDGTVRPAGDALVTAGAPESASDSSDDDKGKKGKR